jgi:hypothetical protein
MGAAGAGLSEAKTSLTATKEWSAKGFLNAPPGFQPDFDNAARQIKFFCPGSEALGLALEGEHPIVSLVSPLRLGQRPLHIPWLVMAFIVNTV